MSLLPDLITADRDQSFRDWSVPVVIRTVSIEYDPETLHSSEIHHDTTIEAILGMSPQQPTPASAAHHLTQTLTISCKRESLPDLKPGPLTRIVWNNTQFELIEAVDNPVSQLVTLHTRRL